LRATVSVYAIVQNLPTQIAGDSYGDHSKTRQRPPLEADRRALETVTTVGFGDIYPITVGGKAFTFFVLMIGLGVVAVPARLVASALNAARRLKEESAPKRPLKRAERSERR
jgi:hypothetical protein